MEIIIIIIIKYRMVGKQYDLCVFYFLCLCIIMCIHTTVGQRSRPGR